MDVQTCCEHCKKSFSSKYTLKKHVDLMVCKNINSVPKPRVKTKTDEKVCTSSKCGYKTVKRSDLHRHIKICKFVEIDNIIIENSKNIEDIHSHHKNELDRLTIKHKNELESLTVQHKNELESLTVQHKNELEKLYYELELLRKEHTNEILRTKNECMDSEHERLTSLLEKAIATPSSVTNTTTTNNTLSASTNTSTNIKGNNNNLQNILASHDLYEKQVDAERIQSIDPSIIEKHFWFGQKGMAKFCVDHIAKVQDSQGNEKMLLCCTDPTRKRFKYYNDDNQVVEDMDARHFIGQVSAPIKTACRDVYDSIMKKIEEERDSEDTFFLANKTTIAQQKLFEINNISDHNRNAEYKQEMSILLNK
jgi:hypothetical protein